MGRSKMQVKELSAEGLKREFQIVVAADEIEQMVSKRLSELSRTARVPGFRPGKVPVSLLRKQYGTSVRGEVLNQALKEGQRRAISDNELKPAIEPKIELKPYDEGKDLEFSLALEILPEVPKVDLRAIELTRLVTPISDDDLNEALSRFVKRFQEYEPLAEPRASQDGDRLTIDFEGRVDGEVFEGGADDNFQVVIGSGSMIPGFEEQLVGTTVGQELEVACRFPDDYGVPSLAGKEASFQVKVKEIESAKAAEIDDDFAKARGFEDLETLKGEIRKSLEKEYGNFSRMRLKRALFDHLAETCKFEVPAGMVDLEFQAVWKQIQEELKRNPEASDKSEDELKHEYRGIAERRVRLGLILSDIGQANEIRVEQSELNRALIEQVNRYPGQGQKVLEFFRNSPAAVEQFLRAPIYEDKVVDFMLVMANVTDKPVDREELMRDPDEEAEVKPSEGESAAG